MWVVSLLLFERQRRQTKRRMHKILGLMTIKNTHGIKTLKESEAKYKSIIDQMHEGVFLTDDTRKVLYANKYACQMLKCSEGHITGCDLSDFVVGNAERSMLNEMLVRTKPGSKSRDEFHMMRGDKDLFWASLSFSCVKALNGHKKLTIIVMVDVTAHILLEQKMRKLTNNLVQKVKQLNCVFDIQQILGEPDQSTERILQRALKIIPQGLRHEHDMRVEIFYDGKQYQTPGYHQTKWYYKVPMKSKLKPDGYISVSYMGNHPPRQSQPFRIGEKVLLKNLAEKLTTALEAKKT